MQHEKIRIDAVLLFLDNEAYNVQDEQEDDYIAHEKNEKTLAIRKY